MLQIYFRPVVLKLWYHNCGYRVNPGYQAEEQDPDNKATQKD